MTPNELEEWMVSVEKSMDSLKEILDVRKILKNSMIEFLNSYFDWDEIKFSKDFRTITLKWNQFHRPVIKHDVISDFPMDWVIEAKEWGVVMIEIHPWGVEDEDDGG